VFWLLLFAHFLSDYPLQSSWMVANKTQFRVLFIHVLIHFLVGFIFVIIVDVELWPYLLLLVSIHFLIDTGKNYLSKLKPDWVIGPYFFDQSIHIVSIYIVALMIANASGIQPFANKPLSLIFSITLLVVTYVGYITERIIARNQAAYFQQVIDTAWPRMIARTGLLAFFLVSWMVFSSSNWVLLSAFINPYRAKVSGARAILTDLVISIGGAFFIKLVI
jgi:hypothetical protein